jgi:hypothetical protein
MIPDDGWPSKNHRSLAEVDETERLRRRKFDRRKWTQHAAVRLRALEARAVELPPTGRTKPQLPPVA